MEYRFFRANNTGTSGEKIKDSTIITSDDVFEYLFDVRSLNEGIDYKKDRLLHEHTDLKYQKFQFRSMDDYEKLKKINLARRTTKSEFVRRNSNKNIREGSNGESALQFFTSKIQENQVYLLDEPENSLSADYQVELLQFIEESARFFNCQFIIATHSPFLLSAKQAKIYDLDEVPVVPRPWTQLRNVRRYYDFFKEHEREFE